MNFQEGMRRIGLTVGVFGALIAAFAAFVTFGDTWRAQVEFESIMKLPETQKIAQYIAREGIKDTSVEVRDHPRIRQVSVNAKSEIESFELGDSKVVWRPSAPSAIWFLLYPMLVGAGFLVPWGAVRLVTWIFSGFLGSATAGT
jgi:hypothetical protein